MSADITRTAIASVRERITSAAARAGRDPSEITLLAATKSVAVDDIGVAKDAGVTVAGENRVQELLGKQEAFPDLEWHLIGPLQRNKVNKVVGRVALIHTVDSLDLAAAVALRAQKLGITQDILIEVNTSGEATKHGFAVGTAPAAAAEMIGGFPGLRVRGLMTMAAPGDRAAARACFADLAAIRDLPAWLGGPELSMGMSDDFEEAVEEGATIVRIGSAIFGARCDLGLGA